MRFFVRVVLLSLCLHAFFVASAVAESGVVESAEQAYTSALMLFERGKDDDTARARTIFAQYVEHKDSARYIGYIDAVAAMESDDFTTAAHLLEPLAAAKFLDAQARLFNVQAMLPYARARREEEAGNFMHAILLYRDMDVLDSVDRLIALRLSHPDYFPAISDYPSGAVDGGYAFVTKDMLPVLTKPGGGEQMDEYPLFTRVQTLAFAYAQDGTLWTCVIRPDVFSYQAEGYSDDIFGFVPAGALHYTGEE